MLPATQIVSYFSFIIYFTCLSLFDCSHKCYLVFTHDKLFTGILLGAEHLESECIGEFCQIEKLSCLFEWLVRTCKGLKPVLEKGSAAETGSLTEVNLPNATLVKYLHKCLLLSSTRNNQLMNSALVLARTIGNNTLVEKLKKLAALHLSNPHEEETLPIISSGSFLSQQEDSLRQAADKLEVFKLQHMKSIDAKTTGDDTEPKSRWVVAKSWNPCSIGMLPRALGSSGQLPVLDCDDYREEVLRSSESTELSESNKRDGKIEADCGLENLDNSSFKRMKESEAGLESYDEGEQSLEGVKGHLMVGGVWKQIREEEMLAIASAIRILV